MPKTRPRRQHGRHLHPRCDARIGVGRDEAACPHIRMEDSGEAEISRGRCAMLANIDLLDAPRRPQRTFSRELAGIALDAEAD